MRTHLAAATIAAASLLALGACDSRDYEAEIATLQTDLQSAQSENEQMQTELEELRTQAQAMPEGGLENVTTQLNTVVQTAAQTFERAGSTEQGASAEGSEAVRADMQTIVQSAQAAAQDLGVELETVAMDTDASTTEGMPEPAAGPDAQQQEPAATEEEPAATPEEQPAEEQEQPQQPAAQ